MTEDFAILMKLSHPLLASGKRWQSERALDKSIANKNHCSRLIVKAFEFQEMKRPCFAVGKNQDSAGTGKVPNKSKCKGKKPPNLGCLTLFSQA